MPLSEHEQRMLDQIESALYAEDPKFASSVRRTAAFGGRRPDVLVVVLGLVGLVLLVGGLFVLTPSGIPVISILGFVVMFAAGVLALRGRPGSRSRSGAAGAGPAGVRRTPAGSAPRRRERGSSGGYTARMEDRFRRRFEG